jgi:hypothetical protein
MASHSKHWLLKITIFGTMNPIKFWQVIKDDSTRTFEVCGQESNTNAFTNQVYGMQRTGLNVSSYTPPVSNKTSSKDLIKITNYSKEDGLYERLLKKYRELSRPADLDDDEI